MKKETEVFQEEKDILSPGRIREEAVRYGEETPARLRRGSYTRKDYEALPEGIRKELIDGRFYDMAPPFSVHQFLAGELHFALLSHIKKMGGPCRAAISPFGVRLFRDDYTMVEPDVFVVCDPDQIKDFGCEGAPDLVMEILSPSTRKKDMTLKLNLYAEAGVREYWIVDPKEEKVSCWWLEDEVRMALYPFDSDIPVGIWNGECVIPMKEIWQGIKKE